MRGAGGGSRRNELLGEERDGQVPPDDDERSDGRRAATTTELDTDDASHSSLALTLSSAALAWLGSAAPAVLASALALPLSSSQPALARDPPRHTRLRGQHGQHGPAAPSPAPQQPEPASSAARAVALRHDLARRAEPSAPPSSARSCVRLGGPSEPPLADRPRTNGGQELARDRAWRARRPPSSRSLASVLCLSLPARARRLHRSLALSTCSCLSLALEAPKQATRSTQSCPTSCVRPLSPSPFRTEADVEPAVQDWPTGTDWTAFKQTVGLVVRYGVGLHRNRELEIRMWARLWTSQPARATFDRQRLGRHAGVIERVRWVCVFMRALQEGDLKTQLVRPLFLPPSSSPPRRRSRSLAQPTWQSVFLWTGAIKHDAWACVMRWRAAQAAEAQPEPAAVRAASSRQGSVRPLSLFLACPTGTRRY